MLRSKDSPLNAHQFDALAKLLRSREPAKTAARLVLLEGLPRKVVCEQTGMSGPAVSQAVRRFKAADTLMYEAYALTK